MVPHPYNIMMLLQTINQTDSTSFFLLRSANLLFFRAVELRAGLALEFQE
jgi:hypothetical protein